MQKYIEIQKSLAKQFRDDLILAFTDFLTKYPICKTIVWNQYTPYFNDGEPCEFRLGDVYFSPIEGTRVLRYYDVEDYEGVDEGPFSLTDHPKYFDRRITEEMRQDMLGITSYFSRQNGLTDFFKASFGNHIWVKVYLQDGNARIDVEDYDHD